jgi:hypothetical protein
MDAVSGGGCIRIDEIASSQSWRASFALRLPKRRRHPMIRFTFFGHGLDMSGTGHLELTSTADATARGVSSRCGSAGTEKRQ